MSRYFLPFVAALLLAPTILATAPPAAPPPLLDVSGYTDHPARPNESALFTFVATAPSTIGPVHIQLTVPEWVHVQGDRNWEHSFNANKSWTATTTLTSSRAGAWMPVLTMQALGKTASPDVSQRPPYSEPLVAIPVRIISDDLNPRVFEQPPTENTPRWNPDSHLRQYEVSVAFNITEGPHDNYTVELELQMLRPWMQHATLGGISYSSQGGFDHEQGLELEQERADGPLRRVQQFTAPQNQQTRFAYEYFLDVPFYTANHTHHERFQLPSLCSATIERNATAFTIQKQCTPDHPHSDTVDDRSVPIPAPSTSLAVAVGLAVILIPRRNNTGRP